jgi:hypothetical protein
MARGLLEVETKRKVGRDRWQPEMHTLPIIAYSWLAEGLVELPPGTSITVGCRLNGTKYEPPDGGEVRHGIQLIVDTVSVPAGASSGARTMSEIMGGFFDQLYVIPLTPDQIEIVDKDDHEGFASLDFPG